MDAPRGRYRVEEKDGRLVVIDNVTGAPASPVAPSPRRQAPPPPPGAPAPPAGLADRYGRLLLSLVVNRWDKEGRALVRWEWEQNGRKQRWDAALGPAEQRRLGRALAAISAFPLAVFLAILAGPGPLWLLFPFAFLATLWGIRSLMRLKRATAGGDSGPL
jgi:hypothetical protein